MDQYRLDDRDDQIRLRSPLDQALKRLPHGVPRAWLERFLRPPPPLGIGGQAVKLGVPGKFVRDWVQDKFLDTLQSMLSDELGEPILVQLLTESNERPKVPVIADVAVSPSVLEEPRFRPSEKFVFDTFVSGPSNRLALAGAKAVAANPGGRYNPFFIYSESGLGKTHLLHAIAHEILKRDPGFQITYVSAQQFSEEYVQAVQTNRIEQFRRSQRNVGIWLVDDIQLVAGRERTQEEIFHTFNYLYSLGKQIVLTSDRPPRDLHFMEDRLRSRFEAGLVADIQLPDTETRCAIVLSKANMEGIEISTEAAMVLASGVSGNIRKLEGALTKLAVQASIDGVAITPELSQELVDRYYLGGVNAKPSFERIIDRVSKHFDVSSDEILGQSRKAPIVHARHVGVYIVRELTGDSWKHIGSLFGDRDHSSMMHGYQKISEALIRDKDLSNTVKMLMREIIPS